MVNILKGSTSTVQIDPNRPSFCHGFGTKENGSESKWIYKPACWSIVELRISHLPSTCHPNHWCGWLHEYPFHHLKYWTMWVSEVIRDIYLFNTLQLFFCFFCWGGGGGGNDYPTISVQVTPTWEMSHRLFRQFHAHYEE